MSDADAIVLDASGGGEMLRNCVASIVGAREIIVFDNGSTTPIRIDGVRVIRSETNIGFAAGVNEAYRANSAEYIAVINNDVILDRDWLAVTKAVLDADKKIGAVQTIIRRDERTIDGAGIDISDGTFRQIGHGFSIGSAVPPAWGVSATAALYRREALGDRVFDPRFFMYYEDVELCARLHDAGWRTVVLPVVKATHRGSASAPILGARAKRFRTRNRYRVARMHPGVGRVPALIAEDLKLLLRGRSSVRGMIEGLCSRL
ncbi:MAG TPA: glycosyltransferase [Thermoanaerobaculia bacterium]